MDADSLEQAIRRHIRFSLCQRIEECDANELFLAVGLAVRDLMIDRGLETFEFYRVADPKRVYYVSMEFLMGRSLENNLQNLGLLEACRQAVAALGVDLADVLDAEPDAALGNGGLGRLAACFLDSMATMDLPAFGYGINYDFGLFRQEIIGGQQRERPDQWKALGTPWQVERDDLACVVPLYGRVEHATDDAGRYRPYWVNDRVLVGLPYDFPIVGYGGRTVNMLRLFSARASSEFDMEIFNGGDYIRAVERKAASETISKVLYPSDAVAPGKELRLVQEYFLVACALQDILRRYLKAHDSFAQFPSKVAIQLNDTHPALAVVELMRLLVDEHAVPWDEAWQITEATCAYTNHTLLPEALERWPVPLLERILPRHVEVLYEINHRFLEQVEARWPGDVERKRRMSLIEEGETKQARMAQLAVVGCHSINGVAAIHSELVKTVLLPDFHQLWPRKFNNKTNGVTPRRWLLACNPGLAGLLNRSIGEGWITDLERLKEIEPLVADASFRDDFLAVKRANKERLARLVRGTTGVLLDPDSLFDVHVKRIHEYKRQLLNALQVADQYLSLVEDGVAPDVPKSYVFAGKASPGYWRAKQIVQLVATMAEVINRDPRTEGRIRVVFVPDYRVSLAEVIIPASDLSEQISTAGTEASGTGNMKLAMNGALTIGTLDGANIEIREAVGPENVFIFGLTIEEVLALRARGYDPAAYCARDPRLSRVVEAFDGVRFSPSRPGLFAWVRQALIDEGDFYLHLADFASYSEAQRRAEAEYADRALWARKAILNVARMGRFSSDRTVSEYAREIWGVEPVPPR
jgi:starch phosphorylase